jgi:sugar phosphate permease
LCIAGPFGVALGMAGLIGVAYVSPAMGFGAAMTVLLVAGAINAVGRSLQQPTLSSLLSKFSERNEQGLVFGMYHGLGSLARVFGPIVAGFAYPHLRNTGQFLLAGGIAVAMGVWTLTLRQSRGQEAIVTGENAAGEMT